MFKSIVLMATLAFATVAQARSLHPCTPTVDAQPIRITCTTDAYTYSIKIRVLMSPAIAQCQGKNHYEYKTAFVQLTDRATKLPRGKVELYDGSFSFKLDDKSTFDSDVIGLHLDHCVSPLNGGMSLGN